MTSIPEVFSDTWNRTGDLKACVLAVKRALASSMPRRPAIPSVRRYDRNSSWDLARKIQAAIATDNDITIADLIGRGRTPSDVLPRQCSMLFIRHLLVMSYPEIGAVHGGRDHSTVMSACKVAEVWLASRPAVEKRLRALAEAAIAPAATAAVDEREAA